MSSETSSRSSASDTEGPDYMEATRMSFGDHLEELRIRLILSLGGIVIGAILGLIFAKSLMGILFQPLMAVLQRHHLPAQLVSLSPASGFGVYMKLGLLAGLILAMPWVLIQVWNFVATGLYPKEQRFARRFLPVSIGLFALGVLFVYSIVLPIVLNFFIVFNESFAAEYGGMSPIQRLLIGGSETSSSEDASGGPSESSFGVRVPVVSSDPASPQEGEVWFNETTGRLNIESFGRRWSVRFAPGSDDARIMSQFSVDFYTSFVLMLMLAFGLAFQLPIAVFFLVWTGLVSTADLGRSRKIVVLVIFIVAAVLTPPDVVSQTLLAIPMWVLFEAGLFFARRWQAAR